MQGRGPPGPGLKNTGTRPFDFSPERRGLALFLLTGLTSFYKYRQPAQLVTIYWRCVRTNECFISDCRGCKGFTMMTFDFLFYFYIDIGCSSS